MVGPRDRSRHRGMEDQQQYELQDLRTSHHSPTGEGSTAHGEDLDDSNHIHRQSSGAQRSHRRTLRVCKARLAGALETCKARSARNLWTCLEWLATHRMWTLLTLSIVLIVGVLLALAYHILGYSPDRGTGEATGHYQSTMRVIDSTAPPVDRIIAVDYEQFYSAKRLHHQVPIAVPSDPEPTGQAKPQDLSEPHVGTGTPASVSGLYFMPMSLTNGDWSQTQQDPQVSSHPASNTEKSESLQQSPTLEGSEQEAGFLLLSRKFGTPRNLSVGQADAGTISFTRRGAEGFLRRRILRSPYLKHWCIIHACSSHKQLMSMCNVTMKNTTMNITDSFKKQECEWCWPKKQSEQIDHHCTEVAKRALTALSIICGILLFCMLAIATALTIRMLRRWRRAKVDHVLHQYATIASSLKEGDNSGLTHRLLRVISDFGRSSKAARSRVDDKTIRKYAQGEAVSMNRWYKPVFLKSEKRTENGPEDPNSAPSRFQKHKTKPFGPEIASGDSEPHQRVPVLPSASPTIGSQLFSDSENMGKGSLLSGAGTDKHQHDSQVIPRRCSRRLRAVSSSSEQISSEATHRRDHGANTYSLDRLIEHI